MRRRSRAGGEPIKTRRGKTAARKRGNALKVRGRGSPARGKETEIARVIRERDQALEQLSEALEQQTATSEVLRVISSSPGALEPVFQTMLENAVCICEAKFGPCIFGRETPSEPLRYTTRRLHSPSSGNADHIGRVRVQSLAVC